MGYTNCGSTSDNGVLPRRDSGKGVEWHIPIRYIVEFLNAVQGRDRTVRACSVYEVYDMVVCNGLGIGRVNRHVSPGDTWDVPERCSVIMLYALYSTPCLQVPFLSSSCHYECLPMKPSRPRPSHHRV